MPHEGEYIRRLKTTVMRKCSKLLMYSTALSQEFWFQKEKYVEDPELFVLDLL